MTLHDFTRLARRQLGLVAARQVAGLGFRRDLLIRLVRDGLLERWHRGVYALTGHPDGWERRALAGQLAIGPPAVLSHRSAARLHGLLDARRSSAIDVLTPRRHRYSVTGVNSHSSGSFSEEDLTRVGPFPVTTVDRTICDLAGRMQEAPLKRLILDAWRRRLTAPERIADCATHLGPVAGTARLRRILEDADPRVLQARSVVELDAYEVVVTAGLPAPQINYRVDLGSGPRFIDLAWPVASYGVEVDSRRHHSTVADRLSDTKRQNALEDSGWLIDRLPTSWLDSDPTGFTRFLRQRLTLLGHPQLT